MMSSKDPLLQPFQLKRLTLKNRVMSTAHEPAYSENGMPTVRYRLYRREKVDNLVRERHVAQVVAEHGTMANADLYLSSSLYRGTWVRSTMRR